MDALDRVYDKAYCEIDDIGKKDKLQMQDIEALDKLVDIIKDIEEMNSSQDVMYSGNNGSYARGRSMRNMYGRNSYANRGYNYARGNSYSRNDSKDVMLEHLADIADMAVDDRDRKAVEKLMDQMRNN